MGFGADMRGRSSHDALLRVQDAEIRVLDTIQHFITMRVENDRKYVSGLNKMLHASYSKAEMMSEYKDCCTIFKAWDVILKETESLMKTLKSKSDHLGTTTLDTLNQLLAEKKAARRKYNEERQRLNSEFNKVQDDVAKHRADYMKCVERLQVDKARVVDLQTKGKGGPKLSDAKSKYVQSVVKLHKQHNDYIVAVNSADQHQVMMNESALPAVLDWHQERQEALVHKTKHLLDDLWTHTTPCDEELQNIGHTVKAAIDTISPGTEYSGTFINLFRSSSIAPLDFYFDDKLLDDYKGTLKAGVIEINDLTHENLQARLKRLTDEAADLKTKVTQTNAEQQKTLVEVAMLSGRIADGKDLEVINSYLEKKQLCDIYTKEVLEGEGIVKKLEKVAEVIQEPLEKLGDNSPPTAVDVQDIGGMDGLSMNSDAASIGTLSSLGTAHNSGSNNPASSTTGGDNPRSSMTTSSSNSTSIKDTNFMKTLTKMKNPFKKGKSASSQGHQGNNNDDDDNFSNISNEDASPDKVDVRGKKQKHSHSYERSDNFLKNSNGSETRSSMMMMLEEGQIMDMDATDAKERMADEEWFHGVLPREEVQRLLVEDGNYLVRESKNKRTHETQFVLSVFWQGHRHFIIQFSPDRGWHFEGQAYPTIQELVKRQHESRLPVTSKSGAILETPILREWELLNDDIELVMRIGTGNFGEVFKGLYKKNQEVAVKTCKDTLTEDQKIKFLQEGRILKHYHHPNIVRYIGIAAQKQPVMIVMEFIVNGALLQYLKGHGDTQTSSSLLQMCVDASSGMSYLAGRGCIHRDLAARNCLVGENNIIKISDFGMSREEETYTVSTGMKQIPVKWTAPEALNFGTYTSQCDVWSFGVLMWEIFSRGRSPYSGMTNAKARQWVEQGHRLESPQGTPSLVYDLMLKCWGDEAKERPQFKAIHKNLIDILGKL